MVAPSSLRPTVDIGPTLKAVLEASEAAGLTPTQCDQLRSLIMEFVDIWHEAYATPSGCINPAYGFAHRIFMRPSVYPVTQARVRTSAAEDDFIVTTVRTLVAAGIVARMDTPWVQNCVITTKKGSTPQAPKFRFTVDMRAVNNHSDPSCVYPLPDLSKLLDRAAGYEFNSSVDIADAFWSLPLHADSVKYTGFHAGPLGVHVWLRMPQGLRDASSYWCQCFDQVLSGLEGTYSYLDDTLCRAKRWADHLCQLRALFERLRYSGLRARLAKSVFGHREILFGGFYVGVKGIRADHDKIAAILALPIPRDVKGLRSILGAVNVFRPLIDNMATMVAPLVAYTAKGAVLPAPDSWTPEMLASLKAVKHALTSAPVLRPVNFAIVPIYVTTDGSRTALAAFMSQYHDGNECPCRYASKACTPAQSRYSTVTELEVAAVVFAIDTFRYWLHARQWVLRTDHAALRWALTVRFDSATSSQAQRLQRWYLHISANMPQRIEFVRGCDNAVSDLLSRAAVERPLAAAVCACAARPSASPALFLPAQATRQSDIDSVPCAYCGDHLGFDNLCICEGCGICIHLRCVVPPRTTPPPGPWFCPACDPTHAAGLSELHDDDVCLPVSPTDPWLIPVLLRYLLSNNDPAELAALDDASRRAVRRYAGNLRIHAPTQWLQVRVTRRGLAESRWLLCPPPESRWGLVQMVHDQMGHAGVNACMAYMHTHWHWRGMRADIATVVRACDACQRRRLLVAEPPPLQEPAILGPFEGLHADTCGPFPYWDKPPKSPGEPPSGKCWVFVIIDYFTKVVEFAVLYGQEPHLYARALWDAWLSRYPSPRAITTDNATTFTREWTNLLSRLSILHVRSSAGHPAANGAAERLVGQFKTLVTKFCNDNPYNWRASLPTLRMALMHRVNGSTGQAPLAMLTCMEPRLPLPVGEVYARAVVPGVLASGMPAAYLPLGPIAASAEFSASNLVWGVDKAVFESIRRQFRRSAERLERRRAAAKARRRARCAERIQPGDYVLEILDSAPSALHAACRGPYKVARLIHRGAIAVLETGETAFRDSQLYLRHVTRLAKYYHKYSPPYPHT